MNKLLTLLVASTLTLAGTHALAADPPKDATTMKKAEAAPKKPDNITAEAWAKMSDAEKAKAAKPAKKEKKGGC